MVNEKRDPCPAGDLQVSRISVGEWRVADGRLGDASPSKVLGFIQLRDGGYDVLHIEQPDRDLRFDDWDAALGSFAMAGRSLAPDALRSR
jgi:hypothetical protein